MVLYSQSIESPKPDDIILVCNMFVTGWFIFSEAAPSEVFLGKSILKIWSKFTGEHPCRSVISIKLQSNFIEITLRHVCSLVNLLHVSRTHFLLNTSRRLLLLQ